MYKTIVVAVDGSDDANLAIDAAVQLGATNDAEVHLVHATEQHPLIVGSASAMAVVPEEVLLKYGAEILDAAKQRAEAASAQKLHIHNLTGTNTAAQIILECVDELGADLVVVGSRGHGRLAGLMMGSVSQKICQLAKCHCLVVR